MKKKIDRSLRGPDFIKYFLPIIDVLKSLGGSGRPREVMDIIVDKYEISDDEMALRNKAGGSTVYNRIAWARFYLVKGGYLDSSTRGVWSLTEKGYGTTITSENSINVFKDIHSRFVSSGSDLVPTSSEKEGAQEEELAPGGDERSHGDILLVILKNLSPEGFERLCQRLLREAGFSQVTVTGKSGDGGIDGYGMLEINPLLSLKVLFQSKRYDKTVGPDKIRDFRGALAGRADKGIFITTGSFTKEAKKESVREGAEPIELVDGERLVKLFEDLEFGLHKRTVYEIDPDFFKEFNNPENNV